MTQANIHRLALYAVLLTAILCVLPLAVAAANSDPLSDSIIVRSRLSLPGGAVTHMFLEETGGRDFLYIEQAQQPGYTVVDVTDDRHPRVLKEVALPRHLAGETLKMVGAGLGVAARPDTPESANRPAIEEVPSQPAQFVRLLDLSDASHTRTLKTFDGVTSIVLDDRHKMIYLTNGDGLWILHHRTDQMREVCQEVSEYSSVPMLCTGD